MRRRGCHTDFGAQNLETELGEKNKQPTLSIRIKQIETFPQPMCIPYRNKTNPAKSNSIRDARPVSYMRLFEFSPS
jgi:hypothetical protein